MVNFPKTPRYVPQVGDYIGRAGIYTKPGVVTQKNDDGTVAIDTSPETIKTYHRHTNTTGLTVEEKDHFNQIMDQVMNAENNADRIQQLQQSIDDLHKTPGSKKLMDFLTNQQAELIRYAKELPKTYNYDVSAMR